MKAAVGYRNLQNSFKSGMEAAAEALKSGNISHPGLVLAFCSGQLDHHEFMQGIQEAVGQVPIIGGSALGVITNENLSYEGFPSGVALFEWDEVKCQVQFAEGLNENETSAGRKLAEAFSRSPEDRLLLMLYDSVKVPATLTSPPDINASSALIHGIESVFQDQIPIIGGGVIGDYIFSPTWQFCGSRVNQQAVAAVLLSGPLSVYARVMQGCSPVDGKYRKITRMSGAEIYELDGQPIVEIIDNLIGDQDWRNQHPLSLLAIGVNSGERFRIQEKAYIIRLITGMLADGSGVGLFEQDLKEGMDIQFMIRDGNLMVESAQKNAEGLMGKIAADRKEACFALYIDCAMRTAGHANTETEEAEEIQKVMNKYGVPMLGFYSGVEIAPIFGKNRSLDWTGVLMVLARDQGHG